MDINESDMVNLLKGAKSILLIEPPYRRNYLPLGLAKIAGYAKLNKIKVTFSRTIKSGKFDLICITTLFTNDIKYTEVEIKKCRSNLFLNNVPILIGGVAASLVDSKFFKNCYVFSGYSKILDGIIPDYNLDYGIKPPWDSFSYLFTQRGCINKCAYCMVHKLEPKLYINPTWKKLIINEKPNTVISDNNILVTNPEHSLSVLQYLKKTQKPVLFNNGIYAKAINKENAQLLAKIKYVKNGFRTAFDRMSDEGYYQRGMQLLLDAGIRLKGNSYTYILFNFIDTPQEAYYRANQAWKFGSNPYLMPYRPFTTDKKGTYVGKHWTLNLIRAFKNWGEIYGYNRGDKTFESWTKSEKSKIKLTDKDWDKWYFQKEKYNA